MSFGLGTVFAVLAPLAMPVAAQPDGAALFAQHCAVCHQADAAGTVGLAPSLKGEHWAKLGADRAYLPTVVLKGLSGSIKVGGQTFVGSMPAFAEQLDDVAVAAVASHLRRLQGAANDAPFVADEVKALRLQPGSPPQSRQRRARLLGS